MPEDNRIPPEVAPVVTGFEDLATPAAQRAFEGKPEPAPTQDEALEKQAAHERELAQRAATRAAANAEERAAAQRAETPDGTSVDLRSEAAKINDQIHQRIIDARLQARKAEEPKPAQPVHKHIMEQTQREMEEGARQSQWHADQRAAARQQQAQPRSKTMSPTPVPEGSTPVFRPDDYVKPTIAGVPRQT
jgi:hypothetical protein